MGLARDKYLADLAETIGITRVAETTFLDRLDISTFQAFAPGRGDVTSVYSGKGLSRNRARLGAIMEAAERTAFLWDPTLVRVHSISDLVRREVRFVAPAMFREHQRAYEDDEPIAWTIAREVSSGSDLLVPAELTFLGDRPTSPRPIFTICTSNGTAAGYTARGRFVRAASELLERHFVSLLERQLLIEGALLERLEKALGLEVHIQLAEGLRVRTAVASRGSPTHELMTRAQKALHGFVCLHVELPIPAHLFVTVGWEMLAPGSCAVNAGYALGSVPKSVFVAALTELAQSRATDRQGSREDYGRAEKARKTDVPRDDWFMNDFNPVSMDSLATYDDLSPERLLSIFSKLGLGDLFAIERPVHRGLRSLRLLCPAAQNWHSTAGRSRPFSKN